MFVSGIAYQCKKRQDLIDARCHLGVQSFGIEMLKLPGVDRVSFVRNPPDLIAMLVSYCHGQSKRYHDVQSQQGFLCSTASPPTVHSYLRPECQHDLNILPMFVQIRAELKTQENTC